MFNELQCWAVQVANTQFWKWPTESLEAAHLITTACPCPPSARPPVRVSDLSPTPCTPPPPPRLSPAGYPHIYEQRRPGSASPTSPQRPSRHQYVYVPNKDGAPDSRRQLLLLSVTDLGSCYSFPNFSHAHANELSVTLVTAIPAVLFMLQLWFIGTTAFYVLIL